MLSVQTRARAALAHFSPSIWRVLSHSLLFGLALSVADLLFNFYLVSLGYANDTAGLLSTVGRGAGMVLGIPIGLLIDRAGPRRALLLGLAIYAAGWALLLASRTLWALIATQFLIGAAYILAGTAVTPLLASVTRPDQRAQAFGMNASATLTVGLLGSAVAGTLPSIAAAVIGSGPQDTAAYRVALASVVVLALVAMLPALKTFPTVGSNVETATATAAPRPLPIRALVRYSLAGLLLGIAGGAILPFQNLFFRTQFGLNDATVGVVLAWVALGMGLGGLLGAPVSKRLGMRRAAAWLRLGAMPAMLLMLFPALLPATVGFFLRGLFVAASFPLNDALVMHATPSQQRGLAASLMSVLWAGGWSVAAVWSGWAQLRVGFAAPIALATVAYLLSALAILTLRVDDIIREA